MGVKWSPQQHAKFKATMAARRTEREKAYKHKKQLPVPVKSPGKLNGQAKHLLTPEVIEQLRAVRQATVHLMAAERDLNKRVMRGQIQLRDLEDSDLHTLHALKNLRIHSD